MLHVRAPQAREPGRTIPILIPVLIPVLAASDDERLGPRARVSFEVLKRAVADRAISRKRRSINAARLRKY